MNRVVSLLQNIRLRQIFTVFCVGITFFAIQAFSYGNQFQAQAEPVTPEATSYQVEKTGDSLQTNVENVKEKAKDKGNNIIEKVVEKLNLNEPLPESTKEFLGETEKNVDNTVEQITGTQGYYKEK